MIKDTLHLKAPGNWINDPNGFIYYKGKYHLFYQHFPYAPFWGMMHWGHAVSEDLIHWEHQKIAMLPTKEYDRNGVFSGSALEVDGKLYLYYSAVRYIQEDPENIHIAGEDGFLISQALLVSPDGQIFDNWNGKQQIIPPIKNPQLGDEKDTRDPKVWREDGCYYMILGSTIEQERGRVLFYKSRDAVNWEYGGQCCEEGMGTITECPDLFPVADHYVFIASPMHVLEDGLEYSAHAVCAEADFDGESCMMKLSSECQYIDYGLDFYAPQTNVDADGRRVMIGWMRMPEAVEDTEDERAPWCGMMSLPRLVELRDGRICFPVHPFVNEVFTKEIADISGVKRYRIQTHLEDGETLNIGGYRIWMEDGRIKTDRSRVFGKFENYRMTAEIPTAVSNCELDIFVDSNLIEVFINQGEYVISHVVYGLGEEIEGNVEKLYEGP